MDNKPLRDGETEAKVLGLLLSDNPTKQARIFREVSEDCFAFAENRALFCIMRQVFRGGGVLDVGSVYEGHKERLAALNTPASAEKWLFSLWNGATLLVDADAQIDRLKELRRMREMKHHLSIAEDMLLRDTVATVEDCWKYLSAAMCNRERQENGRKEYTPEDFADEGYQVLVDAADDSIEKKDHLNTRFQSIQGNTGGFLAGQLVILSAASGTGKSAFALNLLRDFGYTQNIPSLYLNSEMMAKEIYARWFSMNSNRTMLFSNLLHGKYQKGGKIDEEIRIALEACKNITRKKQVYMIDLASMDADIVMDELRMAKERWGIRVAIVDYIGRMGASSFSKDTEVWRQLLNGVGALKEAAKSLEMLVVMVAQLDSKGEKLAQASYMANEADLWINLRKLKSEEYFQHAPCNIALDFRKGRSCKSGESNYLLFDGDYMTFVDNEKQLERIRAAVMKRKTGNDFGGQMVKEVPNDF